MKSSKETAVVETAQDVDAIGQVVNAIDKNAGQEPVEDSSVGDYEKIILDLAHDQASFYHTADKDAYASVRIAGKIDNLKMRTRDFKMWLSMIFYRQMGKAPSGALVNTTLRQLEAEALFDCPEIPVHIRCAEYEGNIFIDLGNEQLEQVKITKDGWGIMSSLDSPVKFIHPPGFLSLPVPANGGSITQLRDFLNVGSDEDFYLIVAWLLKAMTTTGPYPLMIIQGEQGSAKSTASRILRSLVDPSSVPTQSFSRNERDLMIAAGNSWVLNFDNISGIKKKMSNALCRVSTGAGFRTRVLGTDAREMLFSISRPIIINSIEEVVEAHDLADRSLIVNLPAISANQRKPEDVFWREFEAVKPAILGAFYHAVVAGLQNVDDVHSENLPRMADFAKWIIAAEPALPWEEGVFSASYEENRSQVVENAIEVDVVARTILQFMTKHERTWNGTPTNFKMILDDYAAQTGWKKADWPKSPASLSNRLKQVKTFLKEKGILVEITKSGTRKITITKLEKMVEQISRKETERKVDFDFVSEELGITPSKEEATIDKMFRMEFEEGEI